ncbi:hypothetical protein KM043_001764 [Ampulex compressa]|nr:hypothetical protein KM043_001764 [Ampulex compressa]
MRARYAPMAALGRSCVSNGDSTSSNSDRLEIGCRSCGLKRKTVSRLNYPDKKMIANIALLLFLREVTAASRIVKPSTKGITVHMNEVVHVPFIVNSTEFSNFTTVPILDTNIAIISMEIVNRTDTVLHGRMNVTGIFLGTTKARLQIGNHETPGEIVDFIFVTVIPEERAINTIFTTSIIVLVSILYINFGCALDWNVCRDVLRRPVGPLIGFACQFFFMPLLSYGLGYFLFPEQPELQIGMFFTGISPSGGASNIWTILLEGNLNLSVTMTTMCTIAAFGMMPFWIFTLGRHIFEQGQITVPYYRIAEFSAGLVVPLAIGFCIQKKLPKLSKILVRIMKPFSIILIIFIIIFAILTNLYLFKLFSLQIIIAGMGLPWMGFIFGLLAASIFKQPRADIKAISIETGIQNTAVAIFLLRLTLKSPASDLTTIVPVSSAVMTPVPLMFLYILRLIYKRKREPTLNIEPSLENLRTTVEDFNETRINTISAVNKTHSITKTIVLY